MAGSYASSEAIAARMCSLMLRRGRRPMHGLTHKSMDVSGVPIDANVGVNSASERPNQTSVSLVGQNGLLDVFLRFSVRGPSGQWVSMPLPAGVVLFAPTATSTRPPVRVFGALLDLAGDEHHAASRAILIILNSCACPAAHRAMTQASRESMFGETIRSMSQ